MRLFVIIVPFQVEVHFYPLEMSNWGGYFNSTNNGWDQIQGQHATNNNTFNFQNRC